MSGISTTVLTDVVLVAVGETERARNARGELGDPAPAKATSVLTPRELDVLKLVAGGLSNPGIAHRLTLSEHTVHRHLANILRKLDLSSRTAAAVWGARVGLI
jgi:DNA-binding NarL/FixJ family response regulator